MTDALPPNAPLSLNEAAELCLRGLVTASTLRAAADRGELEIERLGRRIIVTPAAIEAWRVKCRAEVRDQGCISNQHGERGMSGFTSSETERLQLAQAAARATALALKESLANTSRANINQPAEIVPLKKSPYQT